MQDTVCDIPFSGYDEDTDWRERMREYVKLGIRIFQDHPWFSDITFNGFDFVVQKCN